MIFIFNENSNLSMYFSSFSFLHTICVSFHPQEKSFQLSTFLSFCVFLADIKIIILPLKTCNSLNNKQNKNNGKFSVFIFCRFSFFPTALFCSAHSQASLSCAKKVYFSSPLQYIFLLFILE